MYNSDMETDAQPSSTHSKTFTTDIDLNYTDKPFVFDLDSRVRVPRNGFKGCGDSYMVNDACLAESDIEKYTVTPEEVLQLKTCFDRINRKTKKEINNSVVCSNDSSPGPIRYWQEKREILRSLFNERYLRLRQLLIRTRYRYNMRHYIVTPPIRQCTHHYDSALRRLCRLDGLSPQELQKKRVYLQRDKDWGSLKSCPRSSVVNNVSLQKLWKTLTDTELVNKSIKDQTQGGKSFLKQVVIPGKMLNCLYGKVLPDPTLQPDEIGIPCHLMEGAFQAVDMNKVAAIVKRDPVFSSDAITTFTRVVRNRYPYITLPSEIITNKQLDFDGDNVSIMMVHSGRCYIETLMRLSAKIAMYCQFYRTRLTFSQTNGFRIAGFLRHVRETITQAAVVDSTYHMESEVDIVKGYFGRTFAHCRYSVHPDWNLTQQLGETLLSLSQQYGPFIAYGFMMNVRSLSFTGYNARRIYPIGPDPKVMAMNIAESGSKGTREAVERMFNMTTTKETRSAETLEYAKTFIEAKSLIRKQGHNAKKMDSAFQNIIVDHNEHLTLRVNNIIYDLGHITNYMQREWIMSDLTTRCLLEDVFEYESSMRGITLACGYRPDTKINQFRDFVTGFTNKSSSNTPPSNKIPSPAVNNHMSVLQENTLHTIELKRLMMNTPFGNNNDSVMIGTNNAFSSSHTTASETLEADHDRFYFWDKIIEQVLEQR